MNFRPLALIIADLERPLEEGDLSYAEFETRRSQKVKFPYLKWQRIRKHLDTYAPGWCFEIVKVDEVKGRVAVTARILIHCAEGLVWRDGLGASDGKETGYGDEFTRARAKALKSAALAWGVGLYLLERNQPSLDEQIVIACRMLGFNNEQLRRWIVKRFNASGLASMNEAQKRQALTLLKNNSPQDKPSTLKEVS